MQLFTWQEPGTQRLVEQLNSPAGPLLGLALNGSDTGTGKTYMALEAAKRIACPTFVVCPKIARTMWKRLAVAFGVNFVDAVNPEKLQYGNTPYYDGKQWAFPEDTLVIWDECHQGASGYDTETTKMLAKLKAYRIRLLLQSATIADSPLKLRAAGFLLGLHTFERGQFFDWCLKNGCRFSDYHRGMEFTRNKLKAKEILTRLHASMGPRLVRIRTDEVPDFPERIVEAKLYDLVERYQKEINRIYAEMEEELKREHSNPMVSMLRARQRAELVKVPLMIDLTKASVDEGKSVVWFINFRETLARMKNELRMPVEMIYGDQHPVERQAGIDRFQDNKTYVMLAMVQAGGVSVSLHDVKHERQRIAYVIPSWSAVHVRQCLGRTHRAGGTAAVIVFVLVADTIEEKVYASIQRKTANIDLLNDGDLQ